MWETYWESPVCIVCLCDNNYKTFLDNEYNTSCGNNVVLSLFMKNLETCFDMQASFALLTYSREMS